MKIQINLRGVPYELVPGYFVASWYWKKVWSAKAQGSMWVCEISSGSHCSLYIILGPNKILDTNVHCVSNTWISISYEFGGFLSTCNNGYSYSFKLFLKMEHFSKLLSLSQRVLLSSWNCMIRKVLRVYYRDSVRKDTYIPRTINLIVAWFYILMNLIFTLVFSWNKPGTYHICEQRRLRGACTSAENRQRLNC